MTTTRAQSEKGNAKSNKKRAVAYARYSTDKQNPISIADQFALIDKHAERQGDVTITKRYSDAAKSGASTINRVAYNDMMQAAKLGEFDVLIVESLDRISRDLHDMAGMFKHLRYFGVEVRTVNEGVVTTMLVGLRGIVGELFRGDVADKIRRHHNGRVAEGKIPGGVSYGYRVVEGKPGEREIDPEQSKTVIWIFEQYAIGVSPRKIADQLNARNVPSPSGKDGVRWTHQAIGNGSAKFGKKGIIHNRLYLGELHWNVRYNMKHPETGNDTRHVRDQKDWMMVPVPKLRIVSDQLWARVHAVRSTRAQAKKNTGGRTIVPRAPSLLSGVLKCGCCGSDMRISTGCGDLRRVVCAAADKSQLDCAHGRSYDLKTIEREAINHVQRCFADPAKVKRFIDAFKRNYDIEHKAALGDAGKIDKRLSEIEGAQRRMVHALELGTMPEDLITKRLQELEGEKDGLLERRKLAETSIGKVALHPATVDRWCVDLGKMTQRLDQDPEALPQLRATLQNLLAEVIVHPTAKKQPYKIEPKLHLAALAQLSATPATRKAADVAREHGVAFSDKGKAEVLGLPISKNEKHVISLGVSQQAA